MTNEAVKVTLLGSNNDGDQIRYTVADGYTISKGTILALSNPMTASSAFTSPVPLCGIASMDKDASDGSTTISAWTNGIFKIYTSGALTAGAPVIIAPDVAT